MNTAIFEAGQASAHSLGPVTGSERLTLIRDALDHNFFIFSVFAHNERRIQS